jgi:hypothetical protein
MFVVQILLLIVTFFSLISQILSLMQTTQEVNPHPRIAPSVNMWSVFFFFFCHFVECWCVRPPHHPGKAKCSGPHHTIKMLHFMLFRSVTRYTNSTTSRIHVNTTQLRNITCTLIAIGVILRSLECICDLLSPFQNKSYVWT